MSAHAHEARLDHRSPKRCLGEATQSALDQFVCETCAIHRLTCQRDTDIEHPSRATTRTFIRYQLLNCFVPIRLLLFIIEKMAIDASCFRQCTPGWLLTTFDTYARRNGSRFARESCRTLPILRPGVVSPVLIFFCR